MVFTDISIFEQIGRRNANISSAFVLSFLFLLLFFKLPFSSEITAEENLSGSIYVTLGLSNASVENEITSSFNPNYSAQSEPQNNNQSLSNTLIASSSEAATENSEDFLAKTQGKTEEESKSKLKSNFNSFFQRNNKNSGNNNAVVNGSDPKGTPDSKNLEENGIADINGTLKGRNILNRDKPSTNYNENGDVIVSVCVMANGMVDTENVRVLTKGSTNNIALRNIAIQNARTYRFEKGENNQCGTITYRFRVK